LSQGSWYFCHICQPYFIIFWFYPGGIFWLSKFPTQLPQCEFGPIIFPWCIIWGA
jgi:hypothetical protein